MKKEKCELLRKSFVNIRENLNMEEFSLLSCGMPVSTSAGSNSPHAMEKVIYNELHMRGCRLDVGIVPTEERG